MQIIGNDSCDILSPMEFVTGNYENAVKTPSFGMNMNCRNYNNFVANICIRTFFGDF